MYTANQESLRNITIFNEKGLQRATFNCDNNAWCKMSYGCTQMMRLYYNLTNTNITV